MHSKCTTKIEFNKVGIEFTEKKITAYGGFSLLAAFFEKIHLREATCLLSHRQVGSIIPIDEKSPNSIGMYSKILAYTLMIYAGGNRFAHLLYLGCQEILDEYEQLSVQCMGNEFRRTFL